MRSESAVNCILKIAAICGIAGVAHADPIIPIEPVTVIGSREAVEIIPGSATYLEAGAIREFAYDDINAAIRRIPGIYIRQEDGYGLFPNISFRGVSTIRNSKITVMEDGIITAPAPYAAPAAYYTPTTARMDAIEVLKGSSQIRFGPQTAGGVLNFISTPLYSDRGGQVHLTYGSDNDRRVHAFYSDVIHVGDTTVAFLLENYRRQVDGFKTIDATTAYPGGNDTGFRKNEPMLKFGFTFGSNQEHGIEFKIGYTDLIANETYLGLTDSDFRENPFRRYAASRFDRIDTRQTRTYLRHHWQPASDFSVTSTAYLNRFARSWYKLNDARLPGESFRNLSQILAGEYGDELIDVLRGTAAGDLRIRDNNRKYEGRGVETSIRWTPANHQIETGIRWHRDHEDRFQRDDVFNMDGGGAVLSENRGIQGTQDNRIGEAEAVAVFVQDRIVFDRLALIPGIRYEHIAYTNTRRSTVPGPDFNNILPGFPAKRSIDSWAPGIGFTFNRSEGISWFGGLHRGISVPGPGDVTGPNQLREETSIGAELGLRLRGPGGWWLETVLFRTDFSDLIVPDNIGGGGVAGRTENAGDVRTQGIELQWGYDPGSQLGLAIRIPVGLSFTYTDATLRSDAQAAGSGGAAVEGVFAGGRAGNRVPYIPEYQFAANAGLEAGRWGVKLNAFFSPATYGTANNTASLRQGADADRALDSRFGRTDRYLLLDLVTHYQATPALRLKAGIENILDWEYIASRVPHGPRPGRPQTWFVGAEFEF